MLCGKFPVVLIKKFPLILFAPCKLHILPGFIRMTFTFHGVSSILNELEKPSIACLLAQYTDSPGRHHCPLALVMFMTRPEKKKRFLVNH